MPADATPFDLPPEAEQLPPEAEQPSPDGVDRPPSPDGVDRPSDRSPRLATIFLVTLGLLVLLGATVPVVSAVDALLANPAQGCGGP
jgi:hypothetical protein